MAIRITAGMVTNQAIRYSQQHQNQLGIVQEQLISGLRVNRPSDDPLAYRSLLHHVSEDSRINVQLENVQNSRNRLEAAWSRVQQARDLFVSVHSEALTAQDSYAERDVAAQYVEEAMRSLMDIANAQFDGDFLFSGTSADKQPFLEQSANGKSSVDYRGSQSASVTLVSVNIQVEVLYVGSDVFDGRDRTSSLYFGPTGAAAGTSVDTATGRGDLIVRNTGTSYAAGSGVAAGTDAATLDTVIGQAGKHRLTIEDTSGTGASGTVRLNSGVKVDFTSADTNLKIQGPRGETVVLDMSSITPGYTGDVDITANGEMSIDDGTTFEAITFSANQLLLHPETNQATYVNSTAIQQAGTDHVEYTGTTNAFQTLQDLANDLRNSRNFSEGDWDKAISRRLGDLERVIDHFISISGQQSVTLQSLESVEVRHEDVQLDTQRVISEIAGTDTATAVLTMQNTQNLLNLTYASSVRLMEQSLLDFLR